MIFVVSFSQNHKNMCIASEIFSFNYLILFVLFHPKLIIITMFILQFYPFINPMNIQCPFAA